MTLREILFTVRAKLKDLGLKRWTDPELVAAVNDGKNRLCHIFRQAREDWFLTSTLSTIPVAAVGAASQVTLPSDFWELKDLAIESTGFEDIVFMHHDRSAQRFRDALTDGGSFAAGTGICFYDIYSDTTTSTLMLSPGWDVAMPLRVTYIRTLADLALPTDVIPFPDEFAGLIPDYAVCEALRSDNDPRLPAYERSLKSDIDSLRTALHPRQIREQRTVMGYLETEDW